MKDWGTHNRDRLVRSLQLYGFGRWPRIRKEAGASTRPLEVRHSYKRNEMDMKVGWEEGPRWGRESFFFLDPLLNRL